MKLLGLFLFLLVLSLVFPSQNPYMVQSVNGATPEPIITREKDSMLYDYGNGTYSRQLGLSPYIFDGSEFVPFIYSNGNQIETEFGSIVLNNDGLYNFYQKGKISGTPLFTDQIIGKYADISDLNTWTYLNSINDETPTNSWDGNSFTSSKTKPTIGKMEYKYVLNNEVWKTQLEATNLSSLTTKVFGFDQIIDLNSDTIKFGGITRNLNNFHGQTFDKQFLINNEGKILDLLNGINFDFDLGFDNLYSITVYDTGAGKSRLVFDYRTSTPLLPNETLIIDPSFSTAGSWGYMWDADNDDNCEATPTTVSSGSDGGSTYPLGEYDSDLTVDCYRQWSEYDISSVPDYAVVSALTLQTDVTGAGDDNCNIVSLNDMATQPQISSDDDVWAEFATATVLVSNDDFCTVIADDELSIGATGISEAETIIQSGRNWIGYGFQAYNDVGAIDNLDHTALVDPKIDLLLTYSLPCVPPTGLTMTAVSDTAIDLSWTAPAIACSVTGYKIERESGIGGGFSTIVADTGNTNTTYSDTGLNPFTTYNYRISAINANGVSKTPFIDSVYVTEKDTSTEQTSPTGLFFSPNGTKMYVTGFNGDEVNEYTLTTAWDLSDTVTFIQSQSITEEATPHDVFFSSNGTKMYIMGQQTADGVHEYTLSNAWDVSSESYVQVESTSAKETFATGLFFTSNGTKMYITGTSSDSVHEYTLDNAWDVSSATFIQSLDISDELVTVSDVFFSSDGTKMFLTDNPQSATGLIHEYDLTNPFDISTATFTRDGIPESAQVWGRDIFLSSDETKYFVLEELGDDVHEYSFTKTTDIDVGITTNSLAFTTTSKDQDGNVLTGISITQTNSSASRTQSVDGSGKATWTGLTTAQNFTSKETTDNFVIDKEINLTPDQVSSNVDLTANIFNVDCSATGVGTDITLKVNDTDGSHITQFIDPVCDSDHDVTWYTFFTADGDESLSENYTSSMIATLENSQATVSLFSLNGTEYGYTPVASKVTSSSFNVTNGMNSYNMTFVLGLDLSPPTPTGVGVQDVSTNVVKVTWSATGTYDGFKIERQVAESGWNILVADTGNTSLEYTDSEVLNGNLYSYRITALLGADDSSASGSQQHLVGSGSSGGGSSGGGSSGGGGLNDVLDNVISTSQTILDLNIISDIQEAVFGEFLDNRQLEVFWEGDEIFNLDVTSIIIANNPITITFPTPPFSVSKENKFINYNVRVPNEVCDDEGNPVGCVEPILYDIQVTISGKVGGNPVTAVHDIQIDLRENITPPFIMILLAIASVIVVGIYKALTRKGRRSSSSNGRRSSGNKNGSARASISRR